MIWKEGNRWLGAVAEGRKKKGDRSVIGRWRKLWRGRGARNESEL